MSLYVLAQEAAAPSAPAVPWWVIVGGWVVSIALAVIAQGWHTRRAIGKHGTDEMNMVGEVRDKVDHMAKLQEQHNTYSERRLALCEHRVDRLEETVYRTRA